MSLPVVFQSGVRDDIDEAYDWYEQQRKGLGEAFLAATQLAVDQITQTPEAYAPIYKAVRHRQVKRFPFAVYYRVEANRIAVIAVHHGKRNPKSWKSRA
jgi:plasmid stabilization system protein ParE